VSTPIAQKVPPVLRGIVPKEVADAGPANWKNANGTGPFLLADYVRATPSPSPRTPAMGQGTIGDQSFKLPFVDRSSTGPSRR